MLHVEPLRSLIHWAVVWLDRQGVDPGLDPVLNHMNYVYTPCQFQKGHFTDGQMITMISKFGTYTSANVFGDARM